MDPQLERTLLAASIGLVFLIAMVTAIRRLRRERMAARLGAEIVPEITAPSELERVNWLTRVLVRSGDDHPDATRRFIVRSAVHAAVGLGFALVVSQIGLVEHMTRTLSILPGNLGQVLVPFAEFLPYGLGLFLVALPWMALYDRRTNLVTKIEAELPMTLELLATMVQAGMGFDASLATLLPIMDSKSPLMRELALMHLQLRNGAARRACFLELRDRLHIPTVSMWTTAMIGAEELGASIGESLRVQATELQAKRRGSAIVKAQALSVKLVFPVVICFLPGLFVITLGPALSGLLQLIDASTAGLGR